MIILVMGVSGSGKSTIGQLLAESLQWQFHDADEFHSPENIAKMSKNIPLGDSDRLPWLMQVQKAIDDWLETKKNVVLACSALKDSYRLMLWRDSQQMRLVYLKGPEKLIQQRLQSRYNHFMSANLLDTQLDILEEPKTALYVDISDSPLEIIAQIQTYLQLKP
ncbi:gluconokinase [Planktothrix mougeotii]|uniref:Gluconokinase n=1 Tax=Planktothrix mougeotii LEGE 06226 TaxID=1828728 RepID=A0ABR9UHX9_9CYAN|nr:gluconokinase [Planktothrix mougeotii]MBE9146064.1 gluconokinase [Planktothrix mougeotii LEGE 06226]